MDLTKYYHLFTQQAQQHLAELDRLLDDSFRTYSTGRLTSAIHDRVHSIKGMALTLQLDAISELCRGMEHFLTNLAQDTSPPDQTAQTIIRDWIGLIKHLADQKGVLTIEAGSHRLSDMLERLDRIPTPAEATPPRRRLTPGHIEFGEFVRPLTVILPSLCRQFRKEVRLEIRGADLTAPFEPKAPLQGILTDLLAYCMACSIETPFARLSKGKKRQGQVMLTPAHNDPYLSIHIIDDGCGIRQQDRRDFTVFTQAGKGGDKALNHTDTTAETADYKADIDWAAHLQRISQHAAALGASLTLMADSSGGAGFLVRFPA